MFQLHDIRKSKVWQEAHETGVEKGRKEGIQEGREEGKSIAKQDVVRRCLAMGMSAKDIAALVDIPVQTVRRLAKNSSK
jgi:predicted transposase/invertase (TIGR01784 family)